MSRYGVLPWYDHYRSASLELRDVRTENKKVCGTAEPKFYGSLTNILTYKGFELNLMFTFSAGGHMINSTRAQLLTYATEFGQQLVSRYSRLLADTGTDN